MHPDQASPARAEEAFTLALRTSQGVRLRSSEAIGRDAEHVNAPLDMLLDKLADAGLLQRTSRSVTLTATGRLLANDVTARLLNAGITKRCIETEQAGYAGTT